MFSIMFAIENLLSIIVQPAELSPRRNMTSLRHVTIKPVVVDAVTRVMDTDHDTHSIEFDPAWTKPQFYMSALESAHLASAKVIGLSKVGVV